MTKLAKKHGTLVALIYGYIFLLASCTGTGSANSTNSAGGSSGGGTQVQVDLSWVEPTTRSDNATALNTNEISGYMIVYGPSSKTIAGNYTVSNVTNVTVQGITVTPGSTWYFSVVTIDTSGHLSPSSNETSITF